MATTTEAFPSSRHEVTRLSAASLRRLRHAHQFDWQVRIQLSSCHHVDGWPETVDVRRGFCIIEDPESIHPQCEIAFHDICDVTVHTAWLLCAGQRVASLAPLAPWRTSTTPADILIGDIVNGDIAIGTPATIVLPDGSRRNCLVAQRSGTRTTLQMRSPLIAGPLMGWRIGPVA